MSKTDKNGKKYNETIAAMWFPRSGNQFLLQGMKIDERSLDAIRSFGSQAEVGGKLILRIIPEEKRKTETSPAAYLEYVTKQDVEAFENSRRNTDNDL